VSIATCLAASDAVLESASKEEIAEVAKILALHVGHYRKRYGDVPITELMQLLQAETITDEIAATLAAGFEALVEAITAMGSPKAEH
jgi:hypothetical protein